MGTENWRFFPGFLPKKKAPLQEKIWLSWETIFWQPKIQNHQPIVVCFQVVELGGGRNSLIPWILPDQLQGGKLQRSWPVSNGNIAIFIYRKYILKWLLTFFSIAMLVFGTNIFLATKIRGLTGRKDFHLASFLSSDKLMISWIYPSPTMHEIGKWTFVVRDSRA